LIAVKCPATDLYSDVANHCQRLWQATGTDVSQTNYTLSNLSSATVAYAEGGQGGHGPLQWLRQKWGRGKKEMFAVKLAGKF